MIFLRNLEKMCDCFEKVVALNGECEKGDQSEGLMVDALKYDLTPMRLCGVC